HTIVGVLPPEADVVRRAQLWVPLARDPLDASQGYSFTGIGRVKPGVTVAEARADLERAHAPIWAERDTARIVSPVVMPLRERLAGDSRPVAIALGLAVGLVLL
ncbi:MAG: ABC transporter ATP-binding protein, partial [Gammaproteobacteria bacterium]|nr:ABC transporter ATP-binding protein [Gemmatimonadota bacterium]NIU79719.1 ABC transporter ATP-binding protein [Gammaproteobacteria bacterium]